MYGNFKIQMIVASKVSCHCGVVIVFDVKYMTFKSVSDSVFFCLPYIFDVSPITFQAIYQVITQGSAFSNFVVGFIVM